jgi:hypothetical protein
METAHLSIIFFIIILICLYKMKHNSSKESFIVLDNEPIKQINDYSVLEHQGSPINYKQTCSDNKCPFYLMNDGKYFIVFNDKKPINSTNPRYFNTYNEAKLYLDSINCPIPKLRSEYVEKNNEDPTVDYERHCNKKTASNNMGIDSCIYYANDLTTLKNYYDIKQDNKNDSLFNYEKCMVDSINDELGVEDESKINYNKIIQTIDDDLIYKSI